MNRESVLEILKDPDLLEHPVCVIFNIVKKYKRDVTIDDIFKNKRIVLSNTDTFDFFPYVTNEEDKEVLKRYHVSDYEHAYMSLFVPEIKKYTKEGQFGYRTAPMNYKNHLRNDATDIQALQFLGGSLQQEYALDLFLSYPSKLDANLEIINEFVPNFDHEKELLEVFSNVDDHFIMYRPLYEDNKGVTLCCNTVIDRYTFYYKAMKYKGCPYCKVSYAVTEDFLSGVLIYNLDDLSLKKCFACKRNNAIGSCIKNGKPFNVCLDHLPRKKVSDKTNILTFNNRHVFFGEKYVEHFKRLRQQKYTRYYK